MKKKIQKYFYLFITLYASCLNSQDNEIGIFFGGTNYIGEVGPTTYIDPLRGEYSSGLLYRKNLSNRFAVRIQYSYANIGSNDNWSGSAIYRKERGKKFENRINEINLGLDFNFLEFETSSNDFQFTPYVNSGISYFRYDTLHYPTGINTAQSYGKANDFAIPVTIGIKLKLINSFIIGFETSARYSFTDNLDGSYPKFDDSNIYSQKPFSNALSKDWYVFSGIILTYLFGNYECDCIR